MLSPASFQNPPAAYRGKPLWCWNNCLSEDELKRQVGVFAEMGMGGFFMHSRVGLATEYLGKEWFRLIRECAIEGGKRGLEAWLYDEDRWPSGSAGGLVTADPAFRMRYLRCDVDRRMRRGSEPVAAFAARLEGLDLEEYRPLGSPKERLRAGEKRLLFSVESVRPHGFFNGATYLDTLNPEAVRRFLEVTHERYLATSGDLFGKVIPGIFTDEPHRGLVMAETPEGWTYPPESKWVTPWTAAFAEVFQERFGYDLRERLPELFFQLGGKRVSPVKWHYMEALHSLFLQSWARQCHEWCERHGLRLTGHMLGEESPCAQSITCGSSMRYYEHLDTPGMDQLGRNNRAFWMARQLGSAARQLGRQWAMSELYGCTGWQTTFADHKEIGDWQAFHGINLRSHHLAWYRMDGESKRDFPASIFFQSNWHREYRAVEDYYARLNLALQQGEAVCDLLVLHPVESAWAQVHVGWGGWIKSLSEAAQKLDRTFETAFRWITAARLDFDYGDEEQLGRLGRVEKRSGASRLRLGRGSYRAVLVCGMETMRGSTLRLLEKFVDAGGRVVFAGPPPSHVDAVESDAPRALSRSAGTVPFRRGEFVEALRRAAPPLARLENAEPADLTRPVLLQVRRDGRAWTVAVCNTDPVAEYPKARLVFEGGGVEVQEWNCRTGERRKVPHTGQGGALRWACALPPLGERVFRIVPAASKLPPAEKRKAGKFREIRGPYAYSLDEPNALVLDRFEWKSGGRWQPETDILAIDRTMREQGGLEQRSLGMVQPWARKESPARKGRPLELRGRFFVREKRPLTLLLEQPERWAVSLNGLPLATDSPEGWFIDPCFQKVAVPDAALRDGENVITLSAEFGPELDLEAIYLTGDFGVYFKKSGRAEIAGLPEALEPGDICRQGLPFYTGRVRYEIPLPGRARRLRLPSFGGAVAAVSVDGHSEILAFPPHETELPAGARSAACEVILTRRNLFGPLHWKRGNKDFVAPDSFRSTGEAYSTEPLLEASGLLRAPEVR